MTRWPAFQTLKGGNRSVRWSDLWISFGLAFGAPQILAAIMAYMTGLSVLAPGQLHNLFAAVWLPIDFFAVLKALEWALAGWAISLTAGGLVFMSWLLIWLVAMFGLHTLFSPANYRAAALFCVTGIIYTGVFWTILYLQRPKAFLGDSVATP